MPPTTIDFCCVEGKYNDIEVLFIREVLHQHGEFVVDALAEKIESLKLKDTGDLLSSLDYDVSNYGINPVLLISFFSYGRAIEIRWHKMRKNKSLFSRNTGKEVWGEQVSRRKRKKTNWYARTAYGSINRLLSVLATEYSEAERERLKGIINNEKMRLS